jgi:hypothetical protein
MSGSQSTQHFQAPAQSDSGSDSDESAREYVLAPSPPPSYYSSAGSPPQNIQSTAPEIQVEHEGTDFQHLDSSTRTHPCSDPQEESSTDPQKEIDKAARPSSNHQTTWNDILRATHERPLEADGDRPITSPPPPNFPNPIFVRHTGYDTAFLRTLPEFAHWNDSSFGEEAFSYDDDMLMSGQISIIDLFLRGAVTMKKWMAWYDRNIPLNLPDEGREWELEEEAVGYRELICGYRVVDFQMGGYKRFFEDELERVERTLKRCKWRRMRQLWKAERAAARAAASFRAGHEKPVTEAGPFSSEEAVPSRQTCSARSESSTHATLGSDGEDGREDTVSLPASKQETDEDRPVNPDKRKVNEKEAECLACHERRKQIIAKLFSTDEVELAGEDVKAEQSENASAKGKGKEAVRET